MKLTIAEMASMPNIPLKGEELGRIGKLVLDGAREDLASRMEWEDRTADAFKLALQVQETKTIPWDNASNVKLPLVTISALQFLSRISLMTKGKKIAKFSYIGKDAKGKKGPVAARISQHINFQLSHQIPRWHTFDEQAKLSAAIVGCAFKKTYFDPTSRTIKSEHIPAKDLILNYFSRDLESSPRITHRIFYTYNELVMGKLRGIFNEFSRVNLGSDASTANATALSRLGGEIQGFTSQGALRTFDLEDGSREGSGATNDGPFEVYEQHCWLDLDDDGLSEPYSVTVLKESGWVLRITARYTDTGDVYRTFDAQEAQYEQALIQAKNGEEALAIATEIEKLHTSPDNHIIGFNPRSLFTQYTFIPSPDNGIYGIGLGHLLGPLNESANSIVNQLIDNGTLGNTAGGFMARGLKMKGGTHNFSPFEWKPVDTVGTTLKDSILPLPVREPSQTLFALLKLIIDYSERVNGSTDIMSGISPGQNTPAETSRMTVEQGMVIFSGIYARMYRAFGEELKKLYEVNKLFLPLTAGYNELVSGEDALISPEDYRYRGILEPAASPEVTSTQQKREKASVLMQLVQGKMPGLNIQAVLRRYLEAWEIEDIDEVYPDPNGPRAIPPQKNPEIELQKAQLQLQSKAQDQQMQLGIATLQKEIRLNEAKILELQAKAAKEFSDAKSNGDEAALKLLELQIAESQQRGEALYKGLDLMLKAAQQESTASVGGNISDASQGG